MRDLGHDNTLTPRLPDWDPSTTAASAPTAGATKGKFCDARPVRADGLEPAAWDHVTPLLADPELIRTELDQRLTQLRATNPATAQRTRLERDLARTTTAIGRLLEAYHEQLLNLDELRARMPELRKRETTVRG